MTIVNITSITKTYSNQPAPVLKDFSLSMNDGEMVALLGPSGSGKSTLLKLITGIERPDSGDIQFDGLSILGIDPNKRGAVLMFQKAYLFPFLNVAENVGFGLRMQAVSPDVIRKEVTHMLELIGLPGIEKRKPAQLSGGEQQRVALARALVIKPKLFLLDEPLNSLDTAVRLNLQEAIRNLQRELGITTILVTHDLGEAMSMSDRLALLLNGRVVAVESPESLFYRPPNVAAAQFVGVTTFLNGKQANGRFETVHGMLDLDCSPEKTCETTFAIRPEHIRVQKEEGKNTFSGVVKDCIFRGEFVEYQVAVDSRIIMARMPMPATLYPHGEQVKVCLPAEHLFEVAE
jgi:ABC-type Fe3+/spermidine/putrescine transport system ATPase subunit